MAKVLSLWSTDYWYRDLGLSYLPVQDMSSVWFLIGTISSQSDITGVMAEVMGTRWWKDGDKPLLNSLLFTSNPCGFLLVLRLSYLSDPLGFFLLCSRYQNIYFCLCVPIQLLKSESIAFTSTHTSFMVVMIDLQDQLTFHRIDRLIWPQKIVLWF